MCVRQCPSVNLWIHDLHPRHSLLFCSFVARVLNPSLHPLRLCDLGARIMGAHWVQPPPGNIRAASLTFADIDGTALSFPPGCLQRPLKRVLCYQAHLAKQRAAEMGWLQLVFDDFWSEGLPYVDKVKAWLGIPY